ncbi:hypothetical protein ACFV99_12830 [Streptomyces sp. NPDC059944]|uniref:hypothetical protein n=1 Tax=unclassified Streptomyces TaxID=2593676 RepID=UPI00364E3A33
MDSRRLAAVRDTGLSAQADAGMDRFARLVTEVLGVPVALVSLIDSERQLFPGMVGLDDPWASARQTPLSHSLCRHPVADGRPFVVGDAALMSVPARAWRLRRWGWSGTRGCR